MEASSATDAEPVRGFDWTGFESPCHAVVETVADAADAEPTRIDPLYDTIDPQALEELLTLATASGRGSDAVVLFEYLGYDVALDSDGDGYLFHAGTATRDRQPT